MISDRQETIQASPTLGAGASLLQSLVRQFDEAVRIVELRRYQRILSAGRLPFVYAAGVVLLAWLFVPFLLGDGGIIAGADPVSNYPGWAAGVMLTISGLGAAVAGYFRTGYLWNQERRLRSFQSWLLSRQDPARVAATTVAMGAVLALALTAVPVLLGLLLAVVSMLRPWQILLSVLLVAVCGLVGAAFGALSFFLSYNLVSRRLSYPGVALLVATAIGLWLRIEAVQHGWQRGWEEHAGRVVKALLLMTPVPAMFGVSAPDWWERQARTSLGVSLPAWAAALLYAFMFLLIAAYTTWMVVCAYRRLAADPDALDERPREFVEEGGQEYYWRGFRNPVWTRDIRTRLRSRDTAEFIFFASIAVAAGAFVPLLMTVSDLSDPLQTARAARQVFFWLTMTLVALVTLITPGLTADVITQERADGTLEMLIGTTLRPRDILIGKLLGAISVMLLLISPSLPLFGLCYLFHGCSGGQVVSVYLLLLVTLTIGALIGLTQSAINAKAGMAKFWAYTVTALLVAFPGGPFWIAAAAAAPQADMRQALSNQGHISAVIAVVWAFVLVLFWGNANEQLEYSEY